MAKKVVAGLKKAKENVKYVKVIQAIKSPTTGSYTFKEEIVLEQKAREMLKS